ncbi:MAG TPA: HAD-IA family hydrolase [Streptosporangiaceae bacterium]|jgi:putative hydrolase of the HAD superfamily|nr:HAD-IA family hydrolase [Streptosporangiaceae bacterium]
MAVEAVVFDFDGLLMDTESTMLASWRHEWRWHGLELDTGSFFADHGGDVSEHRYAKLAAAVGPAYDRAASHARRLAYRDQLNGGLELLPGMADWLIQAGQLGLRLAVATSSGRGWASQHLDGRGSLAAFEFLACGDEVARPKPDPGVYLLALERLGLPASRVVAVEDSPHGVAAAQAAGLRCVAIPNPHTDPARFAAADLVLASAVQQRLDEVLGALEPGLEGTVGQPEKS